MAENEQEMDLETLQAQIDMSMAFTHNLVAGWMKSSKAKLPSASSRANDDAELEEYLRRPSRYVSSSLRLRCVSPQCTAVAPHARPYRPPTYTRSL